MANFTYKDFEYDKYKVEKDSDVDKAKVALESALAKKPNAYQSQWQTQLNDTIDKILNREKFSYDFNGDALYQQYKDKFSQQGKMASADVIGQASAMTGGYGNSYAATVGNQMYQKELQNLNDVIPELYQMAYDRYNREGQDLYNQYAMLGEQENRDYSKYRDKVSDYYTDRDYYANRYDSERNFDYGKYVDDRNFAYGKYADDKSYAYNDYRNAIEDAQWKQQFDETVRQTNLNYKMWWKEFKAERAAEEEKERNDFIDESIENGTVTDGGYDPDIETRKEEDSQKKLAHDNIEIYLNEKIASGYSKSEIDAFLRDALHGGVISQEEYNTLKEHYAPRGNTY